MRVIQSSGCVGLGTLVLLSLMLPSTAWAGGDDPHKPALTATPASVRATMLYGEAPVVRLDASQMGSRRSVPLAFGLSALVPGLGQAYNRNWAKAAVSLSLEAALVTGYIVWRQKGRDGEDAFQAFAHADWDPVKYAQWLNDYKRYQNESGFATITAPDVTIATDVDFANPEAWSATDRRAVDAMFEQIQAVERQSVHPETGASFSHILPFFGDQQYYELIGKYFQFAPGWYDYPAWTNENGEFIGPIDPETADESGAKVFVSDTFFVYADDHAEANTFLRRASRVSSLFIVNHLLAGLDAAISAKLNNDRIDTQFGLAYDPDGRPQPTASLSYRF